jgi:hypothetical protein
VKAALLTPLYPIALDGLPFLGTPAETAGRFLTQGGSLRERAEDMATVHLALCASTGFVCGLGGFMTLPVTLPANLTGVALLQLHLCASTAFLAGEDPTDAMVRIRCMACLTGAVAEERRDEAQEIVDRSAVKIAERGLRLLAEGALGTAEMLGRFGAGRFLSKRLPRRSIPLIGGFIGGASDLYATRKVGAAARDTFLPRGADQATVADLLHAGNGSEQGSE